MPRCIVFGPRDVDVVSIVTRNFPRATILKFGEGGSITGIFPDNPTNELKAEELHVIVLEEDLNSVIWQPFFIKCSVGAPAGSGKKLAEILRQRFNGKPTDEKTKFEVPIPIPPFGGTADDKDRRSREYGLRTEVMGDIEDLMERNGIPVEIGLARW